MLLSPPSCWHDLQGPQWSINHQPVWLRWWPLISCDQTGKGWGNTDSSQWESRHPLFKFNFGSSRTLSSSCCWNREKLWVPCDSLSKAEGFIRLHSVGFCFFFLDNKGLKCPRDRKFSLLYFCFPVGPSGFCFHLLFNLQTGKSFGSGDLLITQLTQLPGHPGVY